MSTKDLYFFIALNLRSSARSAGNFTWMSRGNKSIQHSTFLFFPQIAEIYADNNTD
jgi:hypothetical protein